MSPPDPAVGGRQRASGAGASGARSAAPVLSASPAGPSCSCYVGCRTAPMDGAGEHARFRSSTGPAGPRRRSLRKRHVRARSRAGTRCRPHPAASGEDDRPRRLFGPEPARPHTHGQRRPAQLPADYPAGTGPSPGRLPARERAGFSYPPITRQLPAATAGPAGAATKCKITNQTASKLAPSPTWYGAESARNWVRFSGLSLHNFSSAGPPDDRQRPGPPRPVSGGTLRSGWWDRHPLSPTADVTVALVPTSPY